MGNFIRKLSDYVKSHRNLVIITMVAIFLEVISAAQYYYTHNLLEDELDNRAESELRIKAILPKHLQHHIYLMQNDFHALKQELLQQKLQLMMWLKY